MNGYVVFDPSKLQWLRLEGPFCYPIWVNERRDAEVFTFSQAHAWAEAYGGEVRQ